MQPSTYAQTSSTVTATPVLGTALAAVSWPAIIAGALTAVAMSLIMLFLGSGIGLAAVSPWVNVGVSATAFTIGTALWLALTQFVASGLGGYLTGRLRTRWTDSDADEIYFRDTAHGFLSWALATILTAALLTSVVTTIVGKGMTAATTVSAAAAAGAAATTAADNEAADFERYFTDGLFRSTAQSATTADADVRGEAGLIITRGLTQASFPEGERNYLIQLVAARTGVSTEEATARVDLTINQLGQAKEKAKQQAEKAREAGVTYTLYMFASLLIGAWIAAYAALCGGRCRDRI